MNKDKEKDTGIEPAADDAAGIVEADSVTYEEPAAGLFKAVVDASPERKEKLAFIVGTAALLLIALLIAYLYGANRTNTPSGTVERYLTEYSAKRYNVAYDFLSSRYKEKNDLSAFALTGITLFKSGLKIRNPKAVSEEITGDKAVVKYRIDVAGGQHGADFRAFDGGVARLRKENGIWKVYWVLGLPDTWLQDKNNQ